MSQKTDPCGCTTTTDENGAGHFSPCLACALKFAGEMLVQASMRLADAQVAQQLQDEIDCDFFGGCD